MFPSVGCTFIEGKEGAIATLEANDYALDELTGDYIANAKYIALCSPDNIKRLLNEIEEQRNVLDMQRRVIIDRENCIYDYEGDC